MASSSLGNLKEIEDMEHRVEELRRKFDLYFQGSPEQRIPPNLQHATLGGQLRRMREEATNWNTAERFRLNQLHQRMISFDRMWQRTLKAIEEGTYKRDRLKVALMKRRDEEVAKQEASQVGAPVLMPTSAVRKREDDSFDVDMSHTGEFPAAPDPARRPAVAAAPARPASPPRPSEAPRAAAASSVGPAMSDQRMRQLYDVYMKEKKRTGEKSNLTLDALRAQIDKQVPAIKAKHKCESVDFKVVVKDGKAMLKAIPR